MPGDAGLVLPTDDGATGQFSPAIRNYGFGPAIDTDAAIPRMRSRISGLSGSDSRLTVFGSTLNNQQA